MGVGKSFGVGIIIFIVLNFVMNLLIAIAAGTGISSFFTNIGSAPVTFIASLFIITQFGLQMPGLGIANGIGSGIGQFSSNIFLGIMMILAVIIPGLIAAIVAGKLADGPGKGFGGWMIAMIVSGIIVFVLGIIDASQVGSLISILNPASNSVLFVDIWLVVIFIFNGLFWSGFAAISGRED